MTMAIDQLSAAAEAELAGRRTGVRGSHIYYRQSNGWITTGDASELEELRRRREGWEPLPQYGHFDMTTEYAANHPFELLFMHGGAIEMPRQQVIENGFHTNPPVVPTCGLPLDQDHKGHKRTCWMRTTTVSFPHLRDLPGAAPCHFCDRTDIATAKARDQHESVAHKDEKHDIRVGQTLADHLVKGLQGGSTPQPNQMETKNPVLEALVAVGLNKRQRAALAEAGITVPEEQDGDQEV